MSHTVQVNLTADQEIKIYGERVNIHDIETVYVNDDGVITGCNTKSRNFMKIGIGTIDGRLMYFYEMNELEIHIGKVVDSLCGLAALLIVNEIKYDNGVPYFEITRERLDEIEEASMESIVGESRASVTLKYAMNEKNLDIGNKI